MSGALCCPITGTKLKPLVIRSGSDASAIINTFAISMASLYPVMVLSYEVIFACICNKSFSVHYKIYIIIWLLLVYIWQRLLQEYL